MFERFTDRARGVVVLAQEESRTLGHSYIGTEHILLGLLREQEGLAAQVLESLDITLERVRAEVVRIVGSEEMDARSGQIPFTPRAKKAFELALRESLSLGHNYIGTEHILLGVACQNEGVAVGILLDFDADSEKIRDEVLRMLSGPGGRRQGRTGSIGMDRGWLDFAPAQAFDLVTRLAPLSSDITLKVRRHGELEPTFRVSCRPAGGDDVLRELVSLEALGIRAVLNADGTVRLGRVPRTGVSSSGETKAGAEGTAAETEMQEPE